MLTQVSDDQLASRDVNDGDNLLQITALTKTYSNGFKALNSVDLNISNGMFGLLGPNGAGKSSLMRSIATLQSYDSGHIIFNNIDCVNNPNIIRRNIGYLPQSFGVYPKMSAYQLLNYLAVLKGVNDKKKRQEQVNYLLSLTNLTQHKDKAVATYSGGMKQRFGIAQALLGSPKLLVIDEPTAGLDPAERNSFHNILSEIAKKVIVILSTHIVEDINNLCSNMAILNAGEICFEGQAQTLIDDLQGRVWSKTIAKEEVEQVSAKHNVLSVRLRSGEYHVRLVANVSPDNGFELAEADLEDAYFNVLKQAASQGA